MKKLRTQKTGFKIKPKTLNMLAKLSPMLCLQPKHRVMAATFESDNVELKFRESSDDPATQQSTLYLIATLCYPGTFAEELQNAAIRDSEASGVEHYMNFITHVERRGYHVSEYFEQASDDYSTYSWGNGFNISKKVTDLEQVLAFLSDLQEIVREFKANL